MSSSREKRPRLSKFSHDTAARRERQTEFALWRREFLKLGNLFVIAHSPRRKNDDLCRWRQRHFAERHPKGAEVFVGIVLHEHIEQIGAFPIVHRDRDFRFELLQHFARGVGRHGEGAANWDHGNVHLAEGFDLFVGQLVAQIA